MYGVRAVMPDRLLEDATVVCQDGVIVHIGPGTSAPPPGAQDGRGLFLLPEIIDLSTRWRRLHALDPAPWIALERWLSLPATLFGIVPLVSFRDDVPSVGQSFDDASPIRRQMLGWLASRARMGDLNLGFHQPTTVDDIDIAAVNAASVAIGPTNVATARAAAAFGMHVTAPAHATTTRGRQTESVELVAARCCTALTGSGNETGLLTAAIDLVVSGVVDLVDAVALVTSGPADAAGLPGGRLELDAPGRAVLVDLARAPTVLATFPQAIVPRRESRRYHPSSWR